LEIVDEFVIYLQHFDKLGNDGKCSLALITKRNNRSFSYFQIIVV